MSKMQTNRPDKCRRVAILVLIAPYVSINRWTVNAFSIGSSYPVSNNFQSTPGSWRKFNSLIKRDSYRTRKTGRITLQQTPKGRVSDHREPISQTVREVEDANGTHNDDEDDFTDRLNGSRKSRSLSDLEDEEERRLDLQAQLALSKERKSLLQHSFRAPSKSFSSSNTFELQEELSSSEDVDRLERQEKIRVIIEREDAKYKEERKKKKMGVYADITSMEEFKRKEEEERLRIQQGICTFFFPLSHLHLIKYTQR